MAKDLVIIDSCVLIKAFRKDAAANSDLKEIMNRTAYSVITQLELLIGANTLSKKESIAKIFESYYGIPLNRAISANYFGTRLPDCSNFNRYWLSFINL